MDKSAYNRDDFVNNIDPRWCPGCGDYAILAAFQRLLPQLGLPPENHVVVSGIGCAGRFPYYMNTYGFHTIHGRAPAVATGLKSMRDDLCVWVVTGDGDALSIGGNHFIHSLRRNVNINIILVNNQIYGLTKGQFSPTSPHGKITKTSPDGVNAEPINPIKLALSVGASFVARAVDKDPHHVTNILKAAYEHQGCSLVEIYQDCNIFNKGAFDGFAVKSNRAENTVLLKNNESMLFGINNEMALSIHDGKFRKISADNITEYDIHDTSNLAHAMQLANLTHPDFPVPLGIYYQQTREMMNLSRPIKKAASDLETLFREKACWKQ